MARARNGNARLVTGRSMFNIEGLEEVKNLLETLRSKAPDIYRTELEHAGEIIKNSAKSKIHDDTGALSASVKTQSKFTVKKQQVSVIAGGVQAPHAHLVEFGHRQITKTGQVLGDVPAHPFMRPAYEEYKEMLIQKLTQAIDRLAST